MTTDVVVRRPALWRLFRAPLTGLFDRLAPGWDARRDRHHLAPLEQALAAVGETPRRALDIGTGTGAAAFAVAARWADTEVVGVDMADGMLAEARRKTPRELSHRIRFERGDASRLAYGDASFDLVTLANMIPFFDEIARLVAPGGHAIFAFSDGPTTPIYVRPERVRRELAARGFTEFAEFAAGTGTALLARKDAED
ncbi:MAG: class I SAM-dependent methyltransferase [Actinomycetota bacterium]|nr:class I SAM-dependent methyltransferase [Actinomycetota bacterium]